MLKLIKLNIGCGENKVKDYINIDIEKSVKPDLICDIRYSRLPYKNESVTEITCIHNIEHVELTYWPHIFYEFYRVLKIGGMLILAYPEFEICSKYFLENKRGQRDFWRATLYGRQLYPGDYHVTPCVTGDMVTHLKRNGFYGIKSAPEIGHEYNTFLTALRGKGAQTREDVFKREVFKK